MAELPYATILVSGDDAFEFLQGQLTQDLARLGENTTATALLSAWCNPKGRVICLLRLSLTDDAYALALPAELADPVTRRLTLFRFRSKVDFDTRPASPRELGADGGTTLDVDAWRAHNLAAGIAEIGLAQTEEYTPHMLNLDLLDAVSLDKGCYTGQEIVARTHYRGATRRRLQRFECAAGIAAGEPVFSADRRVGSVVNSIGRELLAVVPVEPADDELSCAGHRLERLPLPYAEAVP